MADISLTASMRSNLLSLQKTQSLMDMTQERLSTGKKVNSAIDSPGNYYAAQSLSNRAKDLTALLDSMGQGIQTIKAADEAIKTITSFSEQAKAIANTARDVPSNFDKYAISSKEVTSPVTGDFIIDARDDLSKFDMKVAAADKDKKFTIYLDGASHEITVAGDNLAAVTNNVINQLQGLGLNATGDDTTGDIKVSTTDGSNVSWVNGDEAGRADGLATATSAAKVVTLDATSGANSATISAAINAAGVTGMTAVADGKAFSISATNKAFTVFSTGSLASNNALETLGIQGNRNAGDSTKPSAERISYSEQFNQILSQIDQLAKDAGYKGVNLLQENNLKVVFNEDRSSTIEIKGVDASARGLGISQAQNDWQKDSNIEKSLNDVENAISKLRTFASDFGNNYSIVQSREEFTDNIVNVLTEGADKLTLADMNEESANMLALQTRQQLAINSLSLASQAAQSVLKLF